MTDINKQKFLAELGKLLTFMYEEDRLEALALYEEMFDSCTDEQQLLHHLVSPTRQAVVLARAYNAKERMLSVQSSSRREELHDDDGGIPAFITAIENIRSEAQWLFTARPAVNKAQLSLFATEEGSELPEVRHSPEVQPAEETAPALSGEEAMSLEEAMDIPAVPEAQEEFILEYDGELQDTEAGEEDIINADDPRLRQFAPDRRRSRGDYTPLERRRIVPLLILYVIFAVPVALVGVALMLIPTVLFLVLALVFGYVGISVLACAFGSFAIFADILVVLGTGLVIIALAVLFLWIFIWFIGGAIAGFVNGVIKLGDRFSSKEVAAE